MNKKRLSLNLIGQLTSFACNMGISFFLTPYIVARLGTETYGFVGLANNVTSYITLFTIAITGMLSRYITVEYSKKNYEEASGYLSTAVITQLILAVVLLIPMMLFAGKVDTIFNVSEGIVSDVRFLWVLVFLSFLIGLPFGGFSSASFAKNRLEIQAIIDIASHAARALILVVAFCFFTPHVWYIGFANLLSHLITIIFNFISKQKFLPEVKVSRRHYNFKYIYKLVVVGIWNSLNRLQQILYTGLDLMITNLFINGTEMGILSIAKTVPTHISTLIGTVSRTFDPTMTISYGKGDMKDFLYQTKFAMKFSGFLCAVPILGFTAFGTTFYRLWMPSLSDAEVMKVQILAVLTLFPQVFSVYIYPLYTVNTVTTKLKIPVLVSIGIGIVNIITVFILLKTTNLGVYAVAGVSSTLWILRIFLFVPIYAAWSLNVKKTTFYPTLFRGTLNVAVIGGTYAIIAHFVKASSWGTFLALCGISGVIGYILCFSIMFNKEEKARALSTVKTKFLKKGKKI
ncbi:MAG: MATE family efflux transporter [Clostridia bacterium]|nr:MATE family efflux transporter [Clostridia bacterium]